MTLFAFVMIFIGIFIAAPIAWLETQRKHRFPYITMVVIIPILFLMTLNINHQEKHAIGGSELVAIVEDNKSAKHEIYHDAETDVYFRKGINEWNPFKMFYRSNLDKEEVVEYLECYEKMQSINLLD